MKPVELENGCWVCFVPEFFKAINYNSVYEDNHNSSKIDEGLQIAQVSVWENEEW